MKKYCYSRKKTKNIKRLFRFLSLAISVIGIAIAFYVSFPLISWQIYFAPVFASQTVNAPIPKSTIVSSSSVQSLISNVTNLGIDYSDARNWFPNYKSNQNGVPKISSYNISIPKLKIKDAYVTTIDNDLDNHLVNYIGTAIPPDNGTAVIYGHSSLPQLFNPKNYKTIFATLHNIKVGDEIYVNASGISYRYKIFSITIVEPEDTSIFTQDYNNSYLTLVTCTPPGTTWKRLIVKSRLQKVGSDI